MDSQQLDLVDPKPAVSTDLRTLLRDRFGFGEFRPHQEEVCRAVAAGEDALLVMPTGSGKSLCYQLPGLARGGTTLVISPLIALMEDQTAKLKAKGFAAEAIHSGRGRDQSRAVCRAYLDGALDFLTIAPERLSVPGFPEMLARRPPTLVAVDEAHCISHWGHDFRPDYRLLKDRLPLFKPAPTLALTATATVRVQKDIVEQLGIVNAKRFIRGFRRDNLAIEAAERPRSERIGDVVAMLEPAAHRPAVVYVPTRKMAEELAGTLGARFPTAAYHAGLAATERSRAQEAFLSGSVEIVVATIAFGMGVDKPDIRTVIHVALPSSVEGYYQEIGRAGRDGKPSRALLLFNWGDRKLHENFFERDYPDTGSLAKLREAIPGKGIEREALLSSCGLNADVSAAALDKLWIHGGVKIDANDVVWPGSDGWQPSYEAIRRYRAQQLDEVLDFAQSGDCRMARLVRYFGDTRDTRPCGICDACKPTSCVGRRFRSPTAGERAFAMRILSELERFDGVSTGTLYRNLEAEGTVERRSFERMLDALARAKAVVLTDDSFVKEGETIRFRRASLGPLGRKAIGGDGFVLEDGGPPAQASAKPIPKAVAPVRRKAEALEAAEPAAHLLDPALVDRLKKWRLATARERGVPAFRIMSDRTLHAIVAARPGSMESLGQIHGAGKQLLERYSETILRIVRG